MSQQNLQTLQNAKVYISTHIGGSEKYKISRNNIVGGILKVWYGQYKAMEYFLYCPQMIF